jgi:hypothetical protein
VFVSKKRKTENNSYEPFACLLRLCLHVSLELVRLCLLCSFLGLCVSPVEKALEAGNIIFFFGNINIPGFSVHTNAKWFMWCFLKQRESSIASTISSNSVTSYIFCHRWICVDDCNKRKGAIAKDCMVRKAFCSAIESPYSLSVNAFTCNLNGCFLLNFKLPG